MSADTRTPDDTLASGDPGDETGRRYQYQYIYTALLACGLLAEMFEEVFCEHHEDILFKIGPRRFRGVQVKTRQQGADLWKATDEEMVSAVSKFVRKDAEFPGQFDQFTLATNHQFFRTRQNGSNLPHLLELARGLESGTRAGGILAKFAKKIVRVSEQPVDQVLRTLRKTNCDDDLPKLAHSVGSLCEHISRHHAPCRDASYPLLRRAADALAAEMARAATLYHEQDLPAYLSLQPNSLEQRVAERIDGKRITRRRVERVLDQVVQAPPELLAPADATPPLPLPALKSRLAKKLTAGGLSAMTVESARDCWSSALKQQFDWNSKLGEERALERHRHLQTIVRNEASAAFEATTASARQGAAMLDDLRRRLRERRTAAPADVFGSFEEQLLGRAYMLTEECKVWWSPKFEITEEGE